jgi:hypothetical protein
MWLGRDFLPEEGEAGKDRVVIMTHRVCALDSNMHVGVQRRRRHRTGGVDGADTRDGEPALRCKRDRSGDFRHRIAAAGGRGAHRLLFTSATGGASRSDGYAARRIVGFRRLLSASILIIGFSGLFPRS